MESTSCDSTVLVIPYCIAIAGSDGATMEEDTGEIKVNEETTKVAAHFLPFDLRLLGIFSSFLGCVQSTYQFFGLFGSSGPSHETYLIVNSNSTIPSPRKMYCTDNIRVSDALRRRPLLQPRRLCLQVPLI